MRAEPVWSDRYWQLKARRNELWEAVPLDWLEATGYDGGCYDPLFRDGVPDGPRERWRLIREFTERWHGVAVPDVGGRGAEVEEDGRRLGVALPPSVREFVAYAHDLGNYGRPTELPNLTLFHCAYPQLEHLTVFPALALVYYTLSDSRLGVWHNDLGLPDPPAYVFHEQWSDDVDYDEDGQPTPRFEDPVFDSPTLSLSVFGNLFTELPTAGGMETVLANPGEFLARLAADFPTHATFDDADVFERDELLVFVSGWRSWMGRPPARQVRAMVRRPIPLESVPAYLFGTDDRDTGSWGMLGPEWFRRQEEERSRQPNYRPPPRWVSVLRRLQSEQAPEPPAAWPPPLPDWAHYDGGDDIPF
jgi:hypothetical protein